MGDYDDIVTFGRVMYEAAWKYGSGDSGEVLLDYFEKPHKWDDEYQKWLELGGTLDKKCLLAFENWLDHRDDPVDEEEAA